MANSTLAAIRAARETLAAGGALSEPSRRALATAVLADTFRSMSPAVAEREVKAIIRQLADHERAAGLLRDFAEVIGYPARKVRA